MGKHTDLHNEIMNLQIGKECPEELPGRLLYKLGHRDARHAAAELAAEYEDNNHHRLVEALREALEWADDHPGMPPTKHLHDLLTELGETE